jgi:secondary thiamine-phosphate synthase enzyme
MNWFKDTLEVPTRGKGLYAFTPAVETRLRAWGVQEGMCFLYLAHTSASLIIGENYDPSAKQDMETFMERLVPDGQPWMRHTLEGADDSSSHLRAMLTNTDLSIPIDGGQLSLGTWQGIYLYEHRAHPQRRQVLLRCLEAA